MVNMSALLGKMLEIILYVIVGFFAGKSKVFDAKTNHAFSQFIVYVGNPALLLSMVLSAQSRMDAGTFFFIISVSTLWLLLLLALALPVSKLLAGNSSVRGTFTFMMTFGSIGIFGLPVIKPLFGDEGMFIAFLMNLPWGVLAFTIGPTIIRGRISKGNDAPKAFFKQICNPGAIVSLAAPLLYFMDLPWPQPIVTGVTALGNMALPLLMLNVGGTLSSVSLKELRSMPRTFGVIAVRQLAIPVIIWALFRSFLHDELFLGVLTMETCMPIGGISSAMSTLYGDHTKEASIGVFVSTLLAIVTVPLFAYLLL